MSPNVRLVASVSVPHVGSLEHQVIGNAGQDMSVSSVELREEPLEGFRNRNFTSRGRSIEDCRHTKIHKNYDETLGRLLPGLKAFVAGRYTLDLS